jgi:hypothetical protein
MSEAPYWPRVEILKTVNGYIVKPPTDFSRDAVPRPDESVYVFTDWPSCSDFLVVVTEPKRPANGNSPQ